MPIYYPDILNQKTAPRTFTYGDKDVMLYALGVGMGRDPMNETELPFVYEKALKVIPTAATVLASGAKASGPAPEMPAGHRQSQINFLMVVHGEQKVELHKPLPTYGTFTAEGRTIGAILGGGIELAALAVARGAVALDIAEMRGGFPVLARALNVAGFDDDATLAGRAGLPATRQGAGAHEGRAAPALEARRAHPRCLAALGRRRRSGTR